MIPPTSIDGTDITGATIDGQDVEEITVDGDTVFSAGIQPFASYPFDEGSGGTINDVIGNNDLTGNGTWIADSDAVGGFKFEMQNDENISRPNFAELDINNSFSVALTLNPAAVSREYILYNATPANKDGLICTIDANQFVAGFIDDLSRAHQASQSINTGRNRVIVTFDSSSNTTTVYVNKNGSTVLQGGLIRSAGDDGGFFRLNRDNSDRYGDGIYDNLQLYDVVLTQTEVDEDFDAQPWTP